LAQALQQLIQDPERRSQLGQAGRVRVVARFGMQSNIAQLARKFGLPTADYPGAAQSLTR